MSNETKWTVGDEAWFPRIYQREVRHVCPVCCGKLAVTVILGNGEAVQTPCDCCGAGFDGPRGYVVDYDHGPKAEKVRIVKVRREEGGDAQPPEYQLDPLGWYAHDDDLFSSESEAATEAARRAALENDRHDRVLRAKKDGTLRKVSWVVGYHRREAKDCRRRAEYHESRVVAAARGETP